MIIKTIYRDQVRRLLLKQMRKGHIRVGQSLSLAAIARDLEVSVTPIREALTQLQTSRIVKAIPNKGFIIPELDKKEAKDLYELVASLEILALENSDFDNSLLQKLDSQQQKFVKASNPVDRVNADMYFHDILTSNYDNPTAQSVLSDLKMRIFFYEIAFMQQQDFQQQSNDHHQSILNYLKNEQKSKAAEVLKHNWLQILEHIKL